VVATFNQGFTASIPYKKWLAGNAQMSEIRRTVLTETL
jgi:hypothetical protein